MAKKKKIPQFSPQNHYFIIYLSFKFQLQCFINKKNWTFISFSYAVRPEEIKYLSLEGGMGCEKKLQ